MGGYIMQAEHKCLNCEFEWVSSPGPTSCPLCGHLYVKWVNYEEWKKEQLLKETIK
jgi:rubrerythrin